MLPKYIRVGAFTYTVSETEEPILVDGKECYGSIDYDHLSIKITNTVAEQRRHHTLAHELVHAIEYDRGIDFKEDDREKTIDDIGVGFIDLIINNQDLIYEIWNVYGVMYQK